MVFTALRVLLLAVLTVLIWWVGSPWGMPLIVAMLFAIILQLPLAVLLFPAQRNRLTAELARAKERRTRERDRLWSELHGEDPGE